MSATAGTLSPTHVPGMLAFQQQVSSCQGQYLCTWRLSGAVADPVAYSNGTMTLSGVSEWLPQLPHPLEKIICTFDFYPFPECHHRIKLQFPMAVAGLIPQFLLASFPSFNHLPIPLQIFPASGIFVSGSTSGRPQIKIGIIPQRPHNLIRKMRLEKDRRWNSCINCMVNVMIGSETPHPKKCGVFFVYYLCLWTSPHNLFIQQIFIACLLPARQ